MRKPPIYAMTLIPTAAVAKIKYQDVPDTYFGIDTHDRYCPFENIVSETILQ